MGPTPYQYLPLWAKVAIERLDADAALRSEAMLDELVTIPRQSRGHSGCEPLKAAVRGR